MGGTISSLCESNKAHSDDDFYDSLSQDRVVIRKLSSKLSNLVENNQRRKPNKIHAWKTQFEPYN